MSDPSAAHAQASAVAEIVVGGLLMAAPWWVQVIAELNFVLATISVLCGAIVGVAGVVRIWRGRRKI